MLLEEREYKLLYGPQKSKKWDGEKQLEDTDLPFRSDAGSESPGVAQPKSKESAEVQIAVIIQINDDVLFDMPAFDLLRHI